MMIMMITRAMDGCILRASRQLRININSLSQCVFPCHHFPGANVIRIFKVKRGRSGRTENHYFNLIGSHV